MTDQSTAPTPPDSGSTAPQKAPAYPLAYLDKAITGLRSLGLVPEKSEEPPIINLIQRISDLDQDRIVAIARTLSHASVFNEVVRDQVGAMKIGERYADIASSFDSIRDDAKTMVKQIEDGKINLLERMATIWMKVTRGDIPARFDKIKKSYLDVAADSNDQIQREHIIQNAYLDFRSALKESEVLALEVLKKAEAKLDEAKLALEQSSEAVSSYGGDDRAEKARLELLRDEQLRAVQHEEERYQIAKDLADNLTVSYNTSEVIMARLRQTTSAKERVYQQAISFFGTNESVLTALSASFTGLFGLHESTQTVEAMKEGVSRSIEDLAEVGGKVQEAALKAGYGPTIRFEAVKKLVNAVTTYQERSMEIIEEMRRLSTQNADEIRDAVEDGKKRLARLAREGAKLEDTPAALPNA